MPHSSVEIMRPEILVNVSLQTLSPSLASPLNSSPSTVPAARQPGSALSGSGPPDPNADPWFGVFTIYIFHYYFLINAESNFLRKQQKIALAWSFLKLLPVISDVRMINRNDLVYVKWIDDVAED